MDSETSQAAVASKVKAGGNERLAWNAWGWFGAGLGSCLWMVVMAAFLVAYGDHWLALLPLSAFVMTCGICWGLWCQRSSITPLNGLLYFLLWLAFCIPAVYFSLDAWASPKALLGMGWSRSIWVQLMIVLIAPGLMLRFWLSHKD